MPPSASKGRGTPTPKSRFLARGLAIVIVTIVAACPRAITNSSHVLTLSPGVASLYVEDSAQFTATLRDESGTIVATSFTWSSDDEAVVRVDSAGLARAIGAGAAVISVEARGQMATASVTVVVDQGQNLTISPTGANLLVDGTQRFHATLKDRHGRPMPATPLWNSSNPAVASVDDEGLARGTGVGSATIHVRVANLTASAPVSVAPRPNPATLVGAGDIATCGNSGDERTADLLDDIAGTVFTVGDNAYPDGTLEQFEQCYDPSWGRHKSRTRPVPGNHEYHTQAASGYFGYFGSRAGDPTKGYYSYDLGGWHVIALNSNLSMAPGSPQELWLRADLADHPARCTLAYMHHPRFSSGAEHGNSFSPKPLWDALYDAGAEVVISGHDHTYERFAPQTPAGDLDMSDGIRQFVVGTGGGGLYAFNQPQPNSEVRRSTHGVLQLTLYPDRYDWEFVPAQGSNFTDSGSASCH